MRVRKVVTRSGRNIRGYYPSRKLGRMVAWESLLERDAIYLLEYSVGIVSFQEQPELVYYWDSESDKHRRYFTDFAATTRFDHEINIEVKPESKLLLPDVRSKLHMVATHFAAANRNFKILTEKSIRVEPLHGNLKLLDRFRQPDEAFTALSERLLRTLQSRSSDFGELSLEFGRDTMLWHLSRGLVRCDLEQPLASGNLVHHFEGINHDQVLF